MWPKDFLRCSDIPLQYPIGIQGSGEDFEPLFCGLFVVDKKFIGSLYVCSQFCVGNPSSFGWVYVLRFGAVTSRENCDKTELGELWNCLVMWNCLGCLPGFVLFGGLNFHSFRLRFWLRSVKWRWNEIRNAKQQTVGFPPPAPACADEGFKLFRGADEGGCCVKMQLWSCTSCEMLLVPSRLLLLLSLSPSRWFSGNAAALKPGIWVSVSHPLRAAPKAPCAENDRGFDFTVAK